MRGERVPGVILAGGRARRMGGRDKGAALLGGISLAERVVTRLSPQAGPLALNVNGDPARVAGLGLPVIADSLPGHPGPLAGILAGLDWAAGLGAARIVTVAVDTPFFPADLVARLAAGADAAGASIALAATRDPAGGLRRHATFGLWPVALRSDLRAQLGAGLRKVTAWADRHGAVDVAFEAAGSRDPFFNVNSPADLAEAEARIRDGPW